MGRIKTKLIKRAAKEIVQRYGSEFGKDFAANKKVVPRFAEIRSKKLKNVITGYITHLQKIKKDF